MSDNTPLLAINNIEAVYGGVILALRGVTLTIGEGEVVSLLGAKGMFTPAGSGAG